MNVSVFKFFITINNFRYTVKSQLLVWLIIECSMQVSNKKDWILFDKIVKSLYAVHLKQFLGSPKLLFICLVVIFQLKLGHIILTNQFSSLFTCHKFELLVIVQLEMLNIPCFSISQLLDRLILNCDWGFEFCDLIYKARICRTIILSFELRSVK